jgi:hypothetical protein
MLQLCCPLAATNKRTAGETQDVHFAQLFAQILGRLLCTYLRPPLGADGVSG